LARATARTEADTVVLAGVNFIAEAAKPLNPGKTVLLPDLGRLARGVDHACGRAAAARGAPAF
jgi:quinolinate synthase